MRRKVCVGKHGEGSIVAHFSKFRQGAGLGQTGCGRGVGEEAGGQHPNQQAH